MGIDGGRWARGGEGREEIKAWGCLMTPLLQAEVTAMGPRGGPSKGALSRLTGKGKGWGLGFF